MTIWTDLLSAIEAEATAKGYTGTLAEIGINQPYSAELITLLELRSKLTGGSGGGGGGGAIEGTVNGYPVAVSGAQLSYTEAQLTSAAQSTTSRSKVGYPAISISYTVGLNGSTSVTVRTEVSNDGTNWLNANLSGADTTQTVSGTYGFVGINQYQFVRFLFVSEAGGTGATIGVIVTLGTGFNGGNGLIEVTASALPTGASTSSLQTTGNNLITAGNASLVNIDSDLTAISGQLPSSLGVKSASQSLSVVPVERNSLHFPVLFERTAATFINTTAYHDCCEFLTSSAGQEVFTPVNTGIAMELVSTSANDTAAGTGARTVGIIYNNASGVLSQTIVTLNGTTPVPLTGITATAINSMSVLTVGSNPTAVGTINLRNVAAPTTIYEQIAANGNQSQSGRFTVPTGYYAVLDDIHMSVQGQPIELKLRATRNTFDGSTTSTFLFRAGIKLAAGGAISFSLKGHVFSAGQTIKVSGITDATTGNPRVHGSIDLGLIAL